MPRDLKEPEGWRVSSLRKILLLRLNDWGLLMGAACLGGQLGDLRGYGPACGFGEVGGFDKGSLTPWFSGWSWFRGGLFDGGGFSGGGGGEGSVCGHLERLEDREMMI
jgi:hypothetical protein